MTRPCDRMRLGDDRKSIAELLDDLGTAVEYVWDASAVLHRSRKCEDQDSAMGVAEVTLDYAALVLARVLDELREIHPVVAGASG